MPKQIIRTLDGHAQTMRAHSLMPLYSLIGQDGCCTPAACPAGSTGTDVPSVPDTTLVRERDRERTQDTGS